MRKLSHAPKNGATKKSYLLNSLAAENLTITNKTLILKVRPYHLSLTISLIDVLQGNLAKFVLAVVRAFLTFVETKVLQKKLLPEPGPQKVRLSRKRRPELKTRMLPNKISAYTSRHSHNPMICSRHKSK